MRSFRLLRRRMEKYLKATSLSGLVRILWTGLPEMGSQTVSTGSFAVERHALGRAPVIAYKNTIANNQLALAA